MPERGTALSRLGFLTIGLFDGDDPGPGHRSTLDIIALGEQLGLDSAWLRHRHRQYGISWPVAVLAAATQRTSRIELGTAVTPLGWENPLRLAEDLVGGEPASPFAGTAGIEEFSRRVQPHSPGLRSRLWYGGASLRSAQWAGEHGMNLLTSSVVRAEESEDFARIQRSHIDAFRSAHPQGRVSQGLVVIPTDTATTDQRARYAAYVAARTPRTATPQGPARMMFARDLIGTSEQIADAPPGSRRSTRSPSPCPSASSTPATCRSSPTWQPGWARRWAGQRAGDLPADLAA